MSENKGQVILYTSQDGRIEVDVIMIGASVWLNQKQLADLFSVDRSVITKHLQNIFSQGELEEKSVCAKFAHTAADRKTYHTIFYNLDIIISVGYRVNTLRGTQFRIWATQHLKEFMTKGFVIDDERLAGNKKSYFDELQERVRAIRTSEKMFYEKIKDIFATSEDYYSASDTAKKFFATIQNVFHYAIHQHTAPELIVKRANSTELNMGLTTWKGTELSKDDVQIAKNYLTELELKRLNLLCDQFLSFAELQISFQKPMFMRDWVAKLVAFLELNERPILKDAGKVSSENAKLYALSEYKKHQELVKLQTAQLRQVIHKYGEYEINESETDKDENSISFGDAISKIANAGKPKS